MARNPHAAANWQRRQAQLRRDAAASPLVTYYVVPRAVFERYQAGPWVELASEADRLGCRIERRQARELKTIHVPDGYAAVYEGRPGEVWLAWQRWETATDANLDA